MTEREDFGRIATAAFVGSMIGVSLFVGGIVLLALSFSESGIEALSILGTTLFALPTGWLIAAFTAWPVGSVIGWLVSLTGPSTGAKAAASGSLTGFVLIAASALLEGGSPAEVSPMEWLYLTGFVVLGAVSGWLAWRWVLRRRASG